MRMKYNTILTIIVLLFVLFHGILLYFIVLSYYSPILQTDSKILDFGEVAEGVRVTRFFDISNEGKTPLVINKVLSGCGCIDIRLSNNIIKPSCSEKLYVTLEGRANSNGVNIYVFSNDINNDVVQLRVKSTFSSNSKNEITSLDLGTIQSDDLPVTKEFKLFTNFETSSESSPKFLKENEYLNIDVVQQDNNNFKNLRITVLPNSPIGEILTEIGVPQENYHSLIRIIGSVKGDCYALPPSLIFGPCQQYDSSLSQVVAFNIRKEKTKVCKIISWKVSESIKECVNISNVKNNLITVTFYPDKYMSIWTNHSITGYIDISLLVHANARELQVRIPIRLILKQKKVRDT